MATQSPPAAEDKRSVWVYRVKVVCLLIHSTFSRIVNCQSSRSILVSMLPKFLRLIYLPSLHNSYQLFISSSSLFFHSLQISNLEVWFQRPKDIVRKLLSGDLDLGIVGLDILTEFGQVCFASISLLSFHFFRFNFIIIVFSCYIIEHA